jgi:hypothetical protein
MVKLIDASGEIMSNFASGHFQVYGPSDECRSFTHGLVVPEGVVVGIDKQTAVLFGDGRGGSRHCGTPAQGS